MESLKKHIGSRKLLDKKRLKALGTRNLLSYYKAERNRYYKFIGSITCECCGERSYILDSKEVNDKLIEDEWSEYLMSVKEILNNRENVK